MHMIMRNPAQMLFLFTTAILAYLVLPPFFFILHTSLVTDRGLQAGSFTIQHFINIVDSLGDVKTLLSNSLIYAVSSSAVALVYGTALAWLAERSDAPFRKLAYISAYVSFAIPGIIKVVGWIMALRADDLVQHRLRYYTNPLSDVEGYLHSQKGGASVKYIKPEDRK